MKKCCGNCKYSKRNFLNPLGKGYVEFYCNNGRSDNYCVPTFYDDTCEDFEEKE